jgi:hypothetical protein
MTSSRASDRLAGEVLVGDGGMGSPPASRLPRLRCPEEANVEAREVVLAAHVEFIRAGADVIQTNLRRERGQAQLAPVRGPGRGAQRGRCEDRPRGPRDRRPRRADRRFGQPERVLDVLAP